MSTGAVMNGNEVVTAMLAGALPLSMMMESRDGAALAAAIASRSVQCAMVHRPSSVSSSTATRHTGRTSSAAVPDCAGSRVLVAMTVQVPVLSGAT